jgi:DNA-binding MarR family transcriptional regulator
VSDKTQQNIVKQIKRLYLLMNKHIERELKKHGLARSQFQVLFYTYQEGKLTQKELLEFMQVEPATLTVIIDGLEKKGLLRRSENKTDKRSKYLLLTEVGKKLREKVPSLPEIMEKKMFDSVKKSDKEATIQIVEKMIENLEKEEV